MNVASFSLFKIMTIGQMLHNWLTKLDWFSTLFPRIPVPIQKQIETKINNYCRQNNVSFVNQTLSQAPPPSAEVEKRNEWRERSPERKRGRDRQHDSRRAYRSKSREKDRGEHRHR